MMKIDLHNHTTLGPDSTADPESTVLSAISSGMDGIAITEHNVFADLGQIEMLKERYGDRLKIFRGVEYTAEEGHVLLFGVSDERFFGLGLYAPVNEIVRAANISGGAAILPHPFREWFAMRRDLKEIEGVCALEGCNGHNKESENFRAWTAARELGLPTTGGSDSHRHDEVGRCYTEFEVSVGYDNFIDALKGGRYKGVSRW